MLSVEYMAGFFDGEGTVAVTTRGREKGVYLRISISNTNQQILHLIKACFGGYLSTPRKKRENWKPSCEWINSGKSAAEFLKLIQPYVILKKGQVALGLEFWEFQRKPKNERCYFIHGKGTNTRIKKKPETLTKEAEFKQRFKALNQKGNGEGMYLGGVN